MKMNSISGLIYKVTDIKRTAGFYEQLGFIITAKTNDSVAIRLNWFWVEFIKSGNFIATGNDTQYLYISVTDAQDTYESLKSLGLEATEPQKFASGRTETMVSDPDGYKLVFFQKK